MSNLALNGMTQYQARMILNKSQSQVIPTPKSNHESDFRIFNKQELIRNLDSRKYFLIKIMPF